MQAALLLLLSNFGRDPLKAYFSGLDVMGMPTWGHRGTRNINSGCAEPCLAINEVAPTPGTFALQEIAHSRDRVLMIPIWVNGNDK